MITSSDNYNNNSVQNLIKSNQPTPSHPVPASAQAKACPYTIPPPRLPVPSPKDPTTSSPQSTYAPKTCSVPPSSAEAVCIAAAASPTPSPLADANQQHDAGEPQHTVRRHPDRLYRLVRQARIEVSIESSGWSRRLGDLWEKARRL